MNKQEIQEWIKSANELSEGYESTYDSCGNHEERTFYEKNGKYYSIYYINGEICEEWKTGIGYVRDSYRPVEVERHTRLVEKVYFESKE